MIKEGSAIGVIAGPPCETWCAARRFELPHGGPRLIRSLAHIWGLPQATFKEWAQLDFDNGLYRTSSLLMYACYMYGAAGILEHPAPPSDPLLPSSWFIPETAHMRQLPQNKSTVDFVWIDQCCFDAPSVKPTVFLVVNQPHFREGLENVQGRGRCCHAAGSHSSLVGLDDQGNFRTAPAKQYPPALCEFLAASLHVSALSHFEGSPSDQAPFSIGAADALDCRLQQFHVPLDPYYEGHSWGAFGRDCRR